MAPVSTEGSSVAQSLISYLRSCWFPRAMLLLGPTDLGGLCCHQHHGDVWSSYCRVPCLGPCFAMMSRACVSTRGHWNCAVLSHVHQSLVLGEIALRLAGVNAAGLAGSATQGRAPFHSAPSRIWERWPHFLAMGVHLTWAAH